eukprot:m.196747 g.196747  ORF g.196747 m.196747 type:complete len:275 (+) comp19892_c0_seq1:190-1014(+)
MIRVANRLPWWQHSPAGTRAYGGLTAAMYRSQKPSEPWSPCKRVGTPLSHPSASAACPVSPTHVHTEATVVLLPRYSVAVTVLDRTGDTPRALMIKRANEPRKGHWYLPGGKVECGETTAQAAARELYEECRLIACYDGHSGASHDEAGQEVDPTFRSDKGANHGHQATRPAQHYDVALHPRAFTVVDAIIPGDSGGPPRWHYAIAQCFARAQSPDVAERAVAGDDAEELKWLTVDEIRQAEAQQGTGGCADVVELAIRLDDLGFLSVPTTTID